MCILAFKLLLIYMTLDFNLKVLYKAKTLLCYPQENHHMNGQTLSEIILRHMIIIFHRRDHQTLQYF